MTKQASLTLKSLHKRYGKVTAVSDVSLDLHAGEITALLGPSGAGKSTLLRLIAGLEYPTSGEISSNGQALSSPKSMIPPEKRGIGLVFQDFALFPNMTAAQNVSFGLKTLSKAETSEVTAKWLDALGIAHRSDAYPHQLSGGEQQRVAIARAIAAKPTAIMMDEPFSGLDPDNRDAVRNVALKAIRAANIPALLVTHDPEEALAHADQIAILENGHLLQTGTPDDLYTHPVSKTVASAFGTLHTLNVSDIPDAWRSILPKTTTTLFYRSEAFQIDVSETARTAKIETMARVGATHRIDATLENGSAITLTDVLGTELQKGDTISITPRPSLFYAF